MTDEKVINPQKVYNVSEAARTLGINEQTLLDYLRNGKIAAQKVGEWKILGKSLMDFLSKKTYIIVTNEGIQGKIEAKDQDDLYIKIASRNYGTMHRRGHTRFTPENVKEIIEVVDE
jgi:hypothetical protein